MHASLKHQFTFLNWTKFLHWLPSLQPQALDQDREKLGSRRKCHEQTYFQLNKIFAHCVIISFMFTYYCAQKNSPHPTNESNKRFKLTLLKNEIGRRVVYRFCIFHDTNCTQCITDIVSVRTLKMFDVSRVSISLNTSKLSAKKSLHFS